MDEDTKMSRREWLAAAFSGLSVLAAYGVLAAEGFLFLVPKKTKPKTRLLFAGQIEQYKIGQVQKFFDLQGGEILVKRSKEGFKAFSSTCPHLGCKVKWEPDQNRFLCPCHMGLFDPEGKAYAGPPADAGQSLSPVTIKVDEAGGVVYIEVEDKGPGRKA